MINYHSIGSVFSVTNSSGTTVSLKAIEKNMKAKADSEMCYYNTYIRRYPMTYMTSAGLVTKDVNLRNCIITLMIDNLVRLRYIRDPNPGENRSNQLCTLPIALQGLPNDSKVVSSWHDPNICDSTEDCACKAERPLVGKTVDELLIQPCEDEQAAWNDFILFTLYFWSAMCI